MPPVFLADSGGLCYTEINLPGSLTKIGSNAFNGCSGLRHVMLPDGLTGLGSSAFKGCSALENMDVPDGTEQIFSSAFEGTALRDGWKTLVAKTPETVPDRRKDKLPENARNIPVLEDGSFWGGVFCKLSPASRTTNRQEAAE